MNSRNTRVRSEGRGVRSDPPRPERKRIRLSREAYANGASTFHIIITAEQRRRYFDEPEFNREVVAILRALATAYRCPVKIYCLMPTHLHLMMMPGERGLIDFIGEFKKKTGDLARKSLGVPRLWQRSFFDHRLRTSESEIEQREYIRMNPLRAGLVDHPDDWPWTGRVDIS